MMTAAKTLLEQVRRLESSYIHTHTYTMQGRVCCLLYAPHHAVESFFCFILLLTEAARWWGCCVHFYRSNVVQVTPVPVLPSLCFPQALRVFLPSCPPQFLCFLA